jgi:hypothetical protein
LQRIYREIEEPMLNATRDQFNANPFAALRNNNAQNENRKQFIFSFCTIELSFE